MERLSKHGLETIFSSFTLRVPQSDNPYLNDILNYSEKHSGSILKNTHQWVFFKTYIDINIVQSFYERPAAQQENCDEKITTKNHCYLIPPKVIMRLAL